MEQDIYEELKSIKQYLLLGAKSALNMDDAAYFNKKELENWMLQIRVSTDEEVEQQAAQYVYNKN